MLRIFSETRDCSGLLAAAACGWLVLWFSAGGPHMHPARSNADLVHGIAMACVMLYPVLVEPTRHVRRSSFPGAQPRQLLLFVSAYALVWAGFGTAVSRAAASIPHDLSAAAFALAIAIAWLWQGSRPKRTAAGQCHATWAVYGGGVAGLSSAARYGLRIGSACLLSCGPLMVAAMLSPWPVGAMLLALLLITRERTGPAFVLRQNAALLGAAAFCALIYAGLLARESF